MTSAQARALRTVAAAVIEAAQQSAPLGAPAGHIYAALMAQGCSLAQYEQLEAGLIAARLIEKHGDCLHATLKGREFARRSAHV